MTLDPHGEMLLQQYRELRPTLQQLADETSNLLRHALREQGIYITTMEHKLDSFGYNSLHYICRMKTGGPRFELQMRTSQQIFEQPVHSATKAFIQRIRKEVFEIQGPDFDFLGMHSMVEQMTATFCNVAWFLKDVHN